MSRSRIGSLGRRLSYWLALQSLTGLIVVCAAVYGATHLGFEARQTEELLQKQTQLRHLLSEAARDGDVATLKHKLDDFYIGHPDMALALTRAADGSDFYRRSAPRPATDQRVARFSVPALAQAQGTLDAVLMLDVRDDAALLRHIGLALAFAALAGTLLVSVGGFLLVRLGLRPVRDLVNQTRQLAADTLHRRLDGSAQPEELEPLIVQFNELLGRLELAYAQMEGFNADVAHELCTPLATMISSTELALRRIIGMQASLAAANCARFSAPIWKSCSASPASCRTCCSCRRQIAVPLHGALPPPAWPQWRSRCATTMKQRFRTLN